MRISVRHLVFLALLGWGGAQAQTIVNTETLLAQVDSGWAATFGVVGDLSFGNSRVTDLSGDGSVGYTSGEMTYRLAASWARLAEDGNAIQENRFAQLRVNREFGVGRWQAFAFVQTAANNILLMQERTLVGAGLRKRAVEGPEGWLDIGWGPFLEREVYVPESGELESDLVRSSLTLATQWQVNDRLEWRNTVYLQSDFAEWADTRLFFESAANMAISERLSFEFDLIYRRDSQPHGGLNPVDVGTAFGLRWEFE